MVFKGVTVDNLQTVQFQEAFNVRLDNLFGRLASEIFLYKIANMYIKVLMRTVK